MKKPSTLPSPSSSSLSSSSSSTNSCDAPKKKRTRKTQINDKCNKKPSRSSIYRGVTRHRWTGRFEAHLWDKTCWNNIQNKKGRQVYLGAYESEEAAAMTYDLAALKYWGPDTILNFPIEKYEKEIEEMKKVSKEEYLGLLRRKSSGFSRGVSKYRGVARHHHNGRWEARIGRVFGNKYLYLGTYNTQEEAAAAYDMAAIEYRGASAVTNFDISRYMDRLKEKGIYCGGEVEQPAASKLQLPLPMPSPPLPPLIVEEIEMEMEMETPPLDEEEHMTWNHFCLDTGSVPHIPAGELPHLFDKFEDNIDVIFEDKTTTPGIQDKTPSGDPNLQNLNVFSSPSSSTSISCHT